MHPILFKIGELEIRTYGVSVALAFLAGIYFASMLGKKEGIKQDDILDTGLMLIIGAVVGARILYILVWWKYYVVHPLEMFKVWEGGLVFYGGLIGASIAGVWWVKRAGLPVLKLCDIFAPFIGLGHAIARIGCYYNGCCYGKVHENCGVVFPALNDNLPHLPVQLYESAANFMNFLVLILFYRFGKRKQGQVFFLYFFNYGIIRFIMEFFRGDPERGTVFFLSTSMFISVFVFLFGSAGLLYTTFKKPKPAN